MSKKAESRTVTEPYHQHPRERQRYGTVVSVPIALDASVRGTSVEIVLKEARAIARQAAEAGDDGTNNLVVSEVIRTNERQAWSSASTSRTRH